MFKSYTASNELLLMHKCGINTLMCKIVIVR